MNEGQTQAKILQMQRTAPYAVTGYFSKRSDATSAVSALQDAGFNESQIIAVFRPEDEEDSGSSDDASLAVKTRNAWKSVIAFFADKSTADLYDKERDGSESYCVAGEPTHGGYADQVVEFHRSVAELNVSADHARYFSHHFALGDEAAIITVAAKDRTSEAEAILESCRADVGHESDTFVYPG